jgi:hypothetical protein
MPSPNTHGAAFTHSVSLSAAPSVMVHDSTYDATIDVVETPVDVEKTVEVEKIVAVEISGAAEVYVYMPSRSNSKSVSCGETR